MYQVKYQCKRKKKTHAQAEHRCLFCVDKCCEANLCFHCSCYETVETMTFMGNFVRGATSGRGAKPTIPEHIHKKFATATRHVLVKMKNSKWGSKCVDTIARVFHITHRFPVVSLEGRLDGVARQDGDVAHHLQQPGLLLLDLPLLGNCHRLRQCRVQGEQNKRKEREITLFEKLNCSA